MTTKSLSLFAMVLWVSSCSGHSSNGTDEAHPEDTASIEEAVVDPAALTPTDDAPKTEAALSPDQMTIDNSKPAAPEVVTAPEISKTEDIASEPIANSVEEPAPVRAHHKAHRKNKVHVTHRKPKVRKASDPDMTVVAVNAAPERSAEPQPELTPAQQAQMAADAAAAAPVATPMAEVAAATPVAPTAQPTIAQVQAAPAETTEPKSNNYVAYGAVAAAVLLGGYFFYRRRKSS